MVKVPPPAIAHPSGSGPGEQMEGGKKKFPLFPADYVTLQELKERRMKEKQQREEEEEREKQQEREKEEMRLRRENEEEIERERRKEEEKKEKKMKEPIKFNEVGKDSSQSKSHGQRQICTRRKNEELGTQERRKVQNVEREQVSEHNPKRKRFKQKNRRKTAEDNAAAGVSPPTLTDHDTQLSIHLSDSSVTTESKLRGDRASHIPSPAVTPSLESEASTERDREITRKIRDLKVVTNETDESDRMASETESSTAVVSEKGISTPEDGETQNIVNFEADGSKTDGRKEFRSRSVAGKSSGRRDRYLSRSSSRKRQTQHEKSRIWIRKEDLSGGGGGDQRQRDCTDPGRFNTSG